MRQELKVIICVGLPGSGKSTWAVDYMNKHDNFVRVNRDDYRMMLTGRPRCEPKIEEMINGLMEQSVVKALKFKCNVIVDNTHLKASVINHLVKLVEHRADIEYMVFDAPLKKCMERMETRDRKVPIEAMEEMDRLFKILKDTFPFQNQKRKPEYLIPRIQPDWSSLLLTAVIFDVDGTLALMGKRSPYDWDKVGLDDVNELVCEQAMFHHKHGRKILIVSGRDEVCRKDTEEWLTAAGVWFDELFMRPKDSMQKDSAVKRTIYNEQIKDRYNVIAVYDDRLSVVEMWHKLGLFVFTVNQGLFEF